METRSVSINRWVDKEDVVCTHSGISSNRGKEGSPAICDNMGESWGHYAKQGKLVQERQIPHGVTYV